MTTTMPTSAQFMSLSYPLPLQFPSGELAISLYVLSARVLRDFLRQRWRRRLFVPLDLFQVVTHVLLVERFLPFARLVLFGGPEPRGIGRQHFVRQDDAGLSAPKLELRVRNDDTLRPRIVGCLPIHPQAKVAQLLGHLRADHFRHVME